MFTVSNIISRVQREKQSVKIMEKYVFCEKTKIHRVLISTLKEKKKSAAVYHLHKTPKERNICPYIENNKPKDSGGNEPSRSLLAAVRTARKGQTIRLFIN